MGGGANASAASSLLAKKTEKDDAFNKKLLEKAGIKTDEENKDEDPKRSISPMLAEPETGEKTQSGIIVTKKESESDKLKENKDWNE